MSKYIKILIIIVIVFSALFLVNHFFTPNMDNQLKDYIIKKGFQETEFENLYEKVETDSKKFLFSTGDYTYMLNIDEKVDDMNTSLNATYNFKEDSIVYSYRVDTEEQVNIYFKGDYKDNNFTCEKEFSNSILDLDDQNNICSLAEKNIKMFRGEARTFFDKYKFVDYIINK